MKEEDLNIKMSVISDPINNVYKLETRQDIEEILGIRSLGIIPVDEKVIVSQNKGIPVISMRSKASRAFMNAARTVANPRIIPVDLNAEDPCIKDKIYLAGKECGYES